MTLADTLDHLTMLRTSQVEHDQLVAIQSDLDISQDIQQAMLPSVFPSFPERTDFDLHGLLRTAKHVGGDLFDYFLMADGRLFFFMSDVSGKGMPTSLLMATTKALFKNHFTSQPCRPLCEETQRINAFLSAENESMMFVTAFLSILDPATGEVEYIDAGHKPPLILRRNNRVEAVPKQGGIALGILGKYDYVSHTLTLAPGDTLFLYTDGVPGERFHMERVRLLLAGATSAASLDYLVYQHLREFIGDQHQFDDITLLILRFTG